MAVIGTFGSFTTARLGIYASQASLQVTGNNIANINTNGYTRQRADLVSLNSTGTAKYANPMGVDIGYGVLVKSTTQLRDPYLDIRFRNENTKLGAAETTLSGLAKIAQTLDEVNKGGSSQNGVIENALHLFKSALNDRDTTMGAEEYDSLVREAAKSLITFFNTASKNLQTDWDNQANELKETVKEVNTCLNNIRDLNEQIRKQGLYGDLALELRDARNVYIDELSGYMGINVEYSMERIDQYTEVEKLTISLKDTQDPKTGQPIKIVDGLYAAQFSFSEVEVNPNYNPNEKQTAQLNPNYDPDETDETAAGFGQYLTEDGKRTNDPTMANMVKLNPDFEKNELLINPAYTEGASTDQYLDDKGQPTNDITKAARVKVNPDYAKSVPLPNPAYEEGGTELPYLKADGTTTDSVEEAAHVMRNDSKDPDALPYLDKDGNAIDGTEPPIAGIERYLAGEDGETTDDITQAIKAGRYLDADGNETNDVENAAPASRKYIAKGAMDATQTTNYMENAEEVDPSNFLLQVERLEDKFGYPLDRGKSTESVVVPLNDTDLAGSVQAMRELLTEEGEFASAKEVGSDANMSYSDIRASDPDANITKGIPYYQDRLDALARKFATMFNEANQLPASTVYQNAADVFLKRDGTPPRTIQVSVDGNPNNRRDLTLDMVTKEVDVTNADGTVTKERVPMDSALAREALIKEGKTDEEIDEAVANAAKYLEVLLDEGIPVEGYEYYDGGVMFSNSGNNNDPSNITAGNISISNAWASRVVHTLRTKQQDEPGISHSSRSDNIDHMISLFEKQLDYAATEIEADASGGNKTYFHGSFQEMYTDIGATLGGEQSTMMGIAYNYEVMVLDLDNDRSSVSGVDLNEEATSMMQFQKSYQAACRLLTTIDSMLDTLINGTLR